MGMMSWNDEHEVVCHCIAVILHKAWRICNASCDKNEWNSSSVIVKTT
jgi:hypothetical protein